ncbi:type II toxin-antitoxin system RelE family toxin [Streptomyces sp. NPDC055134]
MARGWKNSPRPSHRSLPGSRKLGGTPLRRLRVGDYRATYEIHGGTVAI